VQAQRSASEKKRDKRKVNQRFLTAMNEMGIALEKAEVALSETGNVGIEVRFWPLTNPVSPLAAVPWRGYL